MFIGEAPLREIYAQVLQEPKGSDTSVSSIPKAGESIALTSRGGDRGKIALTSSGGDRGKGGDRIDGSCGGHGEERDDSPQIFYLCGESKQIKRNCWKWIVNQCSHGKFAMLLH